MSTASHRIGKHAKEVKKDLHAIGGTAKHAAQEKVEQVGEKAAEIYERGQDRVHGVACSCEQFLRERPLRSVLMAAGLGWLLGRLWKRR